MAPATVYKPTSLDFINRPNPVEPQSAPQQHPLNGVSQLPQASNKHILRLLYGNNNVQSSVQERPAKRRKSGDAQSLDLPKLPVRENAKRLRIPPTLSGLHQPPPNAGLLPSISVEQPAKPTGDLQPKADPPNSGLTGVDEPVTNDTVSVKPTAESTRSEKSKRPKRKKWSDEETACLLKGVAKFGVGNWTKILKYAEYEFNARTALDLKDRFRVCCPDDYKHKSTAPAPKPSNKERRQPVPRPSRRDCKSQAELAELGINQPFDKVARRARHGYSEAEDEALLRGFKLYGKQWASIRADTEYAKAGLVPKGEVKGRKSATHGDNENAADARPSNIIAINATKVVPAKPIPPIEATDQSKRLPTMPLLPDDVFFGAAFDSDFDPDPGLITLDRGILDWPQPQTRTMIDPLATLNLPRPTATWGQQGVSFQPQQQFQVASALPSLAAVTTYGYGFGDGDMMD
ncbi:hypothetical protein LTR78_009438 [Recurvomyces mirabilis]|uniref:Uncharacterized protein n=1 Tax=Recurvomyces mirabilis TaxID=574656 RepID=A0AAE0WFE2_9PEZI|nr:hypothetical protein LTR78_009438 [Recurvomyces mirabilis]KAK5154276.1 hypothetical protein LTS14_006961 [Recurvomyces mirabilis]